MTEGDPADDGTTGPPTAGETLRAAREAQGLSLDDISTRTRVPVRHLAAVESGQYNALPSPTYAVGFARAYARAVGLGDAAIAGQVRAEVNRIGPRQPEYTPFEMADPARVPSRGVAIVAAGLALALLVLGALWFASTRFTNMGGESRKSASDAVVAAVPAVPPPPTAPPRTGGQVTLAATDEVWLRVYDADDKTLYIGNMKAGDRFDVPADARDPKINVGRPDKLAITLNGAAVPPLGDGARALSGVRVGGEAIAQRLSGAPGPGPAVGPIPSSSSSPNTTPSLNLNPSPSTTASSNPGSRATPAVARTAAAARKKGERRPPPRRPRRVLTETQRANLESAARLKAESARGEER